MRSAPISSRRVGAVGQGTPTAADAAMRQPSRSPPAPLPRAGASLAEEVPLRVGGARMTPSGPLSNGSDNHSAILPRRGGSAGSGPVASTALGTAAAQQVAPSHIAIAAPARSNASFSSSSGRIGAKASNTSSSSSSFSSSLSSSVAASSAPRAPSASPPPPRRPSPAGPPTNSSSSAASAMAGSSNTGAGGRPARAPPSAAVIAAALQAQMMGNMRSALNGPPSSGAAARRRKDNTALAATSSAASSGHSHSGSHGPSLTLAQQLGLAPAPAPKLTGEQWSAVRALARERGQVHEPCPICTEEFRDSEQVLLSCSHVFHRVCLASFEKFSGGQRVCPICRAKAYEKKLINDAKVDWRTKCATRIQALWRGRIVRRQYLLMRETIPPREPGKRREFFMRRLSRTSAALARLADSRDQGIDALFADIERAREQVRQGLQAADVQLRAFSEEEWKDIKRRALRRNDAECPICMGTIDLGVATTDTTEEDGDGALDGIAAAAAVPPRSVPSASSVDPKKRAVLLSCSHVLHHGCLLSFERFALASHGLEHGHHAQSLYAQDGDGGSGEQTNPAAPYATLLQQQAALEALSLAEQEEEESGGKRAAATAPVDLPLFQPPSVCLCPLCRSNYQKRWM